MPVIRDPSGALRLGGVDLAELVQRFGTPSYVYDLDAIALEARALRQAFDRAAHLVAYAVKANTAGGIVRTLAREGCGADVVSGAELLVALACGIPPDGIVFSGVAKTDEELDRAIACGPRGIRAIQIESLEEIGRIGARARAAGRRARVSIRVNPGVDLDGVTHSKIATGHDGAKFGVPREDALGAVERVEACELLELAGMATHAGSQFTSTEPYVEAARVLFALTRSVRDSGRGRSLSFVDAGGGFGVAYDAPVPGRGETPGPAPRSVPSTAAFARAVRCEQRAAAIDDLALYVEPGRALVAAHGILLARVVQAKVVRGARWLMIDAGMNDLIRPALYQARHRIVPVDGDVEERSATAWRVAGPVCESSDDFGSHLFHPEPPAAVAILDAGAYGYTMASEYNGRQRPVEVFLASGRVVAATRRRSVEAWAEERAGAGAAR